MRVIIAGSRSINDYALVKQAIAESHFEITTVICGGARGVDDLGDRFALEHNLPIEYFLPDWETHGKRAGFLRNEAMVGIADALIAVWDGVSRGTMHTINLARKHGIKVYVLNTNAATVQPCLD